MIPPVLSHFQARALLAALDAGAPSVTSSLDLNQSQVTLPIDGAAVWLPNHEALDRDALAWIVEDENSCFEAANGELRKIEAFSSQTERYYSLYPTASAPTMLISGIPMHRVKGADPWLDTQSKLRAARPVTGRVLDTCTGLGYTALTAAQSASAVLTIELDPAVHTIIRRNPWSYRLFDTPQIETRTGDSAELIAELDDASFDVILHDPPMFSLAGDLYSLSFYRELVRVLAARGRVFHYIGNPESKSGGTVTRGVVRRLQEAGFRRIVPHPEAFGVTAYK